MIGTKEFTNLNLMAGTVRSLDQSPGSSEDMAIFNRDFDMLVADMKNLVDPELAADLASQKDYYTAAFQVAKGSFGGKPFGGLKASTGQFGMRLIMPQDLRIAAGTETPAFYSWLQTVTTTSAKSYKTGAIGYNSTYCYTQNLANKNEVIAFHRLISYKPNPRVLAVELTINGVGYMPWSVEAFSKIRKADKLFSILPMPGKVLLHPGGFFYITLYFDMETGTTVMSGVSSLEIEIAPFGLTFAEYDFLAAGNIV
jgi:hypothetical protein